MDILNYGKEKIEEEVNFYMKNFHLNKNNAFTDRDTEDFISSIPFTNIKNLGFNWEVGATKLVIIPTYKPYVVKIPLTGDYVFEEYFPFENGTSNGSFNYIEGENNVYDWARLEGFSKMFLPNYYINSFEGIPVYVQPKCEIYIWQDKEQMKYASVDSKRKIKQEQVFHQKRYSSLLKLPEEWVASCLDALGTMEKVYDFIKFLNYFPVGADLHNGNIGYYKGQAIILDYGGYREEDFY